jgi:hypothetical protein
MERIDRRTLNLVPRNGCSTACPLMRSKVRAYSHQGHGPRADQQAGYISATSDSTPSLAKGSRSIPSGQDRKPPISTWASANQRGKRPAGLAVLMHRH